MTTTLTHITDAGDGPTQDPIFGPLRSHLNRGLMVDWINRDLANRAGCDVRRSVVFYDADRVFYAALSTVITEELFRDRLHLIADNLAEVGIRYWSIGVL